jgi:hypothetical protein
VQYFYVWFRSTVLKKRFTQVFPFSRQILFGYLKVLFKSMLYSILNNPWINLENHVIPLLLQHSVCTRKNAQVVTNLQQICSNAVPTWLVTRIRSHCWFPSCSQVVNALLRSCWLNRLVTSCGSNNLLLFQQLVIVQQFINLSTSCEWQPCRFLRVYLILSSFIKQPWINNNVMHEPWLCKACLTYESNRTWNKARWHRRMLG